MSLKTVKVNDKDIENLLKRRVNLGDIGAKTKSQELRDRLDYLKNNPEEIKKRDLQILKNKIDEEIAEQIIREAEREYRSRDFKKEYEELKKREKGKTVLGKIGKLFKSLRSKTKSVKSPQKGGKRRTCKKRKNRIRKH